MSERRAASAPELKAQIEAERAGRPFLVFRDGEDEQAIGGAEGAASSGWGGPSRPTCGSAGTRRSPACTRRSRSCATSARWSTTASPATAPTSTRCGSTAAAACATAIATGSPQQHVGVVHSSQPVHRDHAQHQRDRDRGVQPGLGQPGRAHERERRWDSTTSCKPPSARRCGCSTTSSTSTTTRSRRRATPT